MFLSRQSILVLAALFTGLFSSGCFSNKNKEVAADAPAPPPSAYPTGTAAYSNAGSPVSGTNPVAGPSTGYPAAGAAPQAPAAPAPFQLREGEQLVSHQITSGESLSSIAAKYNTSISRIQSANGMTDSKIFAGKTLQVPTSAMVPDLAMNQAAGASPSYQGQSTQGISAPVVPQGQQAPVNPASTSYSRAGGTPAPTSPSGSFPTPTFQGSQIQFSN